MSDGYWDYHREDDAAANAEQEVYQAKTSQRGQQAAMLDIACDIYVKKCLHVLAHLPPNAKAMAIDQKSARSTPWLEPTLSTRVFTVLKLIF